MTHDELQAWIENGPMEQNKRRFPVAVWNAFEPGDFEATSEVFNTEAEARAFEAGIGSVLRALGGSADPPSYATEPDEDWNPAPINAWLREKAGQGIDTE